MDLLRDVASPETEPQFETMRCVRYDSEALAAGKWKNMGFLKNGRWENKIEGNVIGLEDDTGLVRVRLDFFLDAV